MPAEANANETPLAVPKETEGSAKLKETAPAAKPKEPAPAGERVEALRGVAARIVENMEASREVPTATTVRTIPTKALEENRRVLNRHLERRGRPKLTYTHLISWALMRALDEHPALNAAFEEIDGAPHKRIPAGVNLGLAVDLPRPGGGRTLVVPNVKNANHLTFLEFIEAIDDVIGRARRKVGTGRFPGDDDHPHQSGNSRNCGIGAAPPEGAGGDPRDRRHRVRRRVGLDVGGDEGGLRGLEGDHDHEHVRPPRDPGAESGAYLASVHELLAGEHQFYDSIFEILRVRRRPFRISRDRKLPFVAIDHMKNALERSARVAQLVQAFRNYGHLLSDLDPLAMARAPFQHPELDLEHYGFTIWDLDREFFASGIGGKQTASLREILDMLQDFYGGTVGIEVMHLLDSTQRAWLLERVEDATNAGLPGAEETWQVLRKLIEAEDFERYLHTRYVGKKRFSLEGGEALIPLLDLIFGRAAEAGVEEAVIGMAHRGRLNVLANLVGMPLERIFAEFEDNPSDGGPAPGDVKYHLGFEGIHRSQPNDRELAVTVAANPSHLEAVNPVVEGMARAKQDALGDTERKKVLPVLIHGDAAFAGQGIVPETLGTVAGSPDSRPAARSTSSSTIRSATPPIRRTRARRCTAATWRR